jgi:hypothetical protein
MSKGTKQLDVGEGFKLPLDAITQTIAVLGNRGSGKTNTGVVIVEGLLDHGQQTVIIDPTDVWFGLKSSADGTKAGFPVVVCGGRHQDLPLSPADGNAIADLVVDHRLPVILSLRHFETQAEMRRFVTDFARRLYFRKGQTGNNTPLLLTIDEASLFVPQRFAGDDAKMVGAIQKIVRQGRVDGLGVMLIDQRAASVNKDVLTQIELLVAHRHTSPQDRAAVEAWVEAKASTEHLKEFMASLPGLKKGEAWFWSPEWLDVMKRVQVRRRRTFDSSATPKAGEEVIAPKKLADVDLEALKGKLAASIEEAKANDPEQLKKRIRELEAAAKKSPAAAAPRQRLIRRSSEGAAGGGGGAGRADQTTEEGTGGRDEGGGADRGEGVREDGARSGAGAEGRRGGDRADRKDGGADDGPSAGGAGAAEEGGRAAPHPPAEAPRR